jgi:uncharacterized protein YdaU (DUF1376 family)
MHYYQFNIGDYRAATAHLSNEEDLAYRRLLDMYYDTENQIPLDTQWVAKRLRLDTEVVKSVLQDMFKLTEVGWHHGRCEAVIDQYHAMAEKNRANGRLGGRKKNPVASDSQPIAKATINDKPITINHKPIKEKATVVATPVGVSQSVWDDFKTLRKAKKAPITQRAIDGLIAEANKAGWTLEQALTECCVRGWQAFKAEWVADKPKLVNRFDVVTTTVPSRVERDPALVKLDEDSKRVVRPSPEVLARIRAVTGKQA